MAGHTNKESNDSARLLNEEPVKERKVMNAFITLALRSIPDIAATDISGGVPRLGSKQSSYDRPDPTHSML